MFMRMIYDDKLAQAAYLIGCQASGEAIIIDPLRDVDQYIKIAEENDLRIIATAETHIHADFISGSRELAESIGAKVYVSDEGDEDWKYQWLDKKLSGGTYDHQLLEDGDVFNIGKIGFRVIHTPGHTPEHIVFLVTDHGSGATAPIALATGDFVFVGDLGRPDLLETAAGQIGAMEPSARRLFQTIQTLDDIPDFVQVWPAHGAGSACGKALGAVPTSTIGYERRFNPALNAASSEQNFVDFILAGQPEPPLYFANMKRDNKIGPPVLGQLPIPPRMTTDQLRSVDPTKAVVIDTRDWEAFRVRHIPGSLSFPLRQSFNTDVGSMVRDTDEIYLIIKPEQLEVAVRDLVRIGLDNLRGWFDASRIKDYQNAAHTFHAIREIGVHEAVGELESKQFNVLDVRRSSEFKLGHLPGALNFSHTRIASHIDELPKGAPLLIYCRTDKRSARTCALLQREGFEVTNLEGGIVEWEQQAAAIEY